MASALVGRLNWLHSDGGWLSAIWSCGRLTSSSSHDSSLWLGVEVTSGMRLHWTPTSTPDTGRQTLTPAMEAHMHLCGLAACMWGHEHEYVILIPLLRVEGKTLACTCFELVLATAWQATLEVLAC